MRPVLPPPYRIPKGVTQVEETIRRSRFVTFLATAPDSGAAKAFVRELKGRFPDATHHCWAFNVGPPGSTANVGMSDDGEPSGTAGRPMLHALLHSDIGDGVVVCVRYYGGTKLGTGGLARAYSSGVTRVVEAGETEWKIDRTAYRIAVSYNVVEGVERVLSRFGAEITDRDFGESVCLHVLIASADEDDVVRALADVTNGQAEANRAGDPG